MAMRVSNKAFGLALVVGLAVCGLAVSKVSSLAGSRSENGTYEVSDFDIVYPYDDPRPDVGPSDALASVAFTSSWPPGGFPGRADCHVALQSAGRGEVGHLDFELVTGTNGSHTKPIVMPVSARPETASGYCFQAAGQIASGVGYILTGPTRIEPARNAMGDKIPDRTAITFEVRWAEAEADPGLRTCFLRVDRVDGTMDAPQKFNLLDKVEPVTLYVDGSPATVASAEANC